MVAQIALAQIDGISVEEMQRPGSDSISKPIADEDEWVVSCRCESAKAVSTLLSCLQHISGSSNSTSRDVNRERLTQSHRRSRGSSTNTMQPVTVFCSPSSLTFHVSGSSKQIQASVDIQAGLFSEYRVVTPPGASTEAWQAGGEVRDFLPQTSVTLWLSSNIPVFRFLVQIGAKFCVNLSTVVECLHLLGTQNLDHTKLFLSYNLTQELFKIELLEESGVLSTTAIPGMLTPEDEIGNSLALAFRSSPVAARIIVKSETLGEIITELECVTGASCATCALGPNGLEMATVGHLGECLVSIPARGSHVVSLELSKTESAQARSYPLSSFLGSMRGLDIAEETCITMNTSGMMAIQHQVIDANVGDGKPNFVDFIMVCLEDEDDEDDDASNQSAAGVGPLEKQHVYPGRAQAEQQEESSFGLLSHETQSTTHRSRDHDTDESDDDVDDRETNATLTSTSVTPLFSSVIEDSQDQRPRDDFSSRSVRPRTISQPRRDGRNTLSKTRQDDYSPSEQSRNLLDETEADEEETENQLDVTAPVSPLHHPYRGDTGDCSSPELVYGRQH
jgi:hypothetical protein